MQFTATLQPVRRVSSGALVRFAAGLALALVYAVPQQAQSTPSTSQACTLSGLVQSGNVPLPGAAIVALGTDDVEMASTSSEQNGTYVLRLQAPGTYRIKASLAAFAPVTREATLAAGDCSTRLDLVLMLASRAPAQSAAARSATGTAAPTQPAAGAPPAAPAPGRGGRGPSTPSTSSGLRADGRIATSQLTKLALERWRAKASHQRNKHPQPPLLNRPLIRLCTEDPAMKYFAIGALSLLAVTAPAVAHHPFDAEFDATMPITFSGKVTSVDWAYPHVVIHVEATEAGATRTWELEAGNPAEMLSLGWRMDTLKGGEEISVQGYKSKTEPSVVAVRMVGLANGQKLPSAGDDGGPSG